MYFICHLCTKLLRTSILPFEAQRATPRLLLTLELRHCPSLGRAVLPAATVAGARDLLPACTPERAMSDQAAAGSGGGSQPARHQQGGGAAAAAAGLIAGAQQQESPPFVGVFSRAGVGYLTSSRIDRKLHQLARCATRAEAAAAHDLGLIWKRLHGKGGPW